MTEFKWQAERWLASNHWQEVLSELRKQVNSCQSTRCLTRNNDCMAQCSKPMEDLIQWTRHRTELYAQQGAKYCKTECWEATDLKTCVRKCTQEYQVLFEELKAAVVLRAQQTNNITE